MTPQTLSAALAPVIADMPMRYFGDWQYGSVSLPTEAAELVAVGWLTTELLKAEKPSLVPEYWATSCHDEYSEGWAIDSHAPELNETYPTLIEALVSALVAARGSTTDLPAPPK